MDSLALFNMLDAKMAYVSQRQNVLADNIANANTPGFRPRDVKEPNFKDIMAGKQTAKASIGMEDLAQTNPNHIGAQNVEFIGNNIDVASSFYEVKPSENAVDLEEQMLKASSNQRDANIAINMYVKQLSLMRTAIGANGR